MNCLVKLLAVSILTSFNVMSAQVCQSLDAFKKFEGTWQQQNQDTSTTERWFINELGELVGKGTFKRTSDNKVTTSVEHLRILMIGEKIYYLAKPQQNNVPVAFKLTECSANRWLFINEQHDFPNKIHYTLNDHKRLVVEVSDMKNKGFTLKLDRAVDE